MPIILGKAKVRRERERDQMQIYKCAVQNEQKYSCDYAYLSFNDLNSLSLTSN